MSTLLQSFTNGRFFTITTITTGTINTNSIKTINCDRNYFIRRSLKGKTRTESDIEKYREESEWRKILELAQSIGSDGGRNGLIEFLLGEAKLELYLEGGDLIRGQNLLKESRAHLKSCLNASNCSALQVDANLLLAKLHFMSGEQPLALKVIEASGISSIIGGEKPLPHRIMKLVAESFAIKGMCLEKEKSIDKGLEKAITCLTKASDLTLRYLQNMEKHLGPYAIVSVGPILETGIQRAPILFIQNDQITKAFNQYRSIMNVCETQSTLNTRQVVSRKLAELIIRSVSRSCWTPFDTSITTLSGHWKPHRYFGQSLFNPREREEEVILLLLISEMLAARNVVLDRGSEFNETRRQSLENVIAIHDLLVIALTPCKYYILDMFEKAMKFSFEIKHIWLQFGLSVMETRKFPLRAILIFKEVARIDSKDPVPCILAAKVYILELNNPEKALEFALEALNRDTEGILASRINLTLGIVNAILYEEETETVKKLKKLHLHESIKYFQALAKGPVEDHLAYYHLGLHMAHQRVINDSMHHAQLALVLNPYHLPSIQLMILCLSALKKYQEALSLCEASLEEYPDQLVLLYVKAHLEQVVSDNGYELALQTAKHMLRCCKNLPNEDKDKVLYSGNNVTLTGTNYDTLSLKMEQTLSEIVSLDSCPILGEGAITIGPGLEDGSLGQKQLWNLQLHLWILIAELYIKLGLISEAEACVAEVANVVFGPLSHQLMYVKGILAKARQRYAEAKSYFQNAISINPRHARALQQLGHSYYLLGNHLSADKYLRDSLNVDATLHETWSHMGCVLNELGEHKRAADCLVTAIQLEATAPILPFNLSPRNVFE
ncbi:tetratricopeptide repeat protein 7B-like isoform X1 [Panonychus citri]|uniref:tetratricopeptide repeat protein 7B-like isoform X1 n=1 Tax=Panonychus citri TaxID=50023 RepID=UPI0023080B36|nr:tetratricopeptide repeat protein 7B-like isoform X1 [Panonychus citri]